jgi:hypothetical protein
LDFQFTIKERLDSIHRRFNTSNLIFTANVHQGLAALVSRRQTESLCQIMGTGGFDATLTAQFSVDINLEFDLVYL